MCIYDLHDQLHVPSKCWQPNNFSKYREIILIRWGQSSLEAKILLVRGDVISWAIDKQCIWESIYKDDTGNKNMFEGIYIRGPMESTNIDPPRTMMILQHCQFCL
jgi:predicted phosphohydrolase